MKTGKTIGTVWMNTLVVAALALVAVQPASVQAALPGYQTQVLSQTPYSFHRFHEASGTTATDTSGNSRNGTYTGSPTFGIAGAGGTRSDDNAVGFNGSSQYMTIPGANTLGTQLKNVTFEAVFRTTNTTAIQDLFATFNDSASMAVAFSLNSDGAFAAGSHYFYIRSSGTQHDLRGTFTNADLTNGEYHHLMIAVNLSAAYNDRYKVYVNGVAQTVSIWHTTTTALSASSTFADFQYAPAVGARNLRNVFDRHFNGEIDEFVIYTKTLTADDAAAHATAALPLSRYHTEVIKQGHQVYSFHRFNETGGTTAIGLTGRNGTYTGSPTFGIAGVRSDNNAVGFNGSSQYMTIPGANTLGTQLKNVTFEAVFRTTNTTATQALFGTFNDGASMAVAFSLNADASDTFAAGSHRFYIRSSTNNHDLRGTFTNADLTNGEYHHLMIAVNLSAAYNDRYKVYVNGVAQTVTITYGTTALSASSTFADFQYALAVGARNVRGTVGQHFNGVIDEFVIYTKTLTAADALAHTGALFPFGTVILVR